MRFFNRVSQIVVVAVASIALLFLVPGKVAFAHQDGCHRHHSCPSDRGTYVCGDTGNFTYCPENSPSQVAPEPTTAPATTVAATSLSMQGATGTINKRSNIRSGPGQSYGIVGSGNAGQPVTLIGKNADGSWLQIGEGKWIAAFLVNMVSGSQPAVPAAPAAEPFTQVAQQEAQPGQLPVYWKDASKAVCGNFEWKVTDVRRPNGLWQWGEGAPHENESFLVIYVEIKNVGSVADQLHAVRPSLGQYDYEPVASSYAAWMMTGGNNHPLEYFNPGSVITLAIAYDVPRNDAYGFAMSQCAGTAVNIGEWNALGKDAIRANTN